MLTVRNTLLNATHRQHQKLNQHPILISLTSPELSLSSYHSLLISYHYLYKSLEKKIVRFISGNDCPFDYTERCKLPWLVKDILFLQNDWIDVDKKNTSLSLPDIKSLGQLIGTLYVIEGSTLGGQFISRSLKKHHGLTLDNGATFFHAYGEKTMPMWNNFLLFAETIVNDAHQRSIAEQTAGQIFRLFEELVNTLYSQSIIQEKLA